MAGVIGAAAKALGGVASQAVGQVAPVVARTTTSLASGGGLNGFKSAVMGGASRLNFAAPDLGKAPSAFSAAMRGRLGGLTPMADMAKTVMKGGNPMQMAAGMLAAPVTHAIENGINHSPFAGIAHKAANMMAPVARMAEPLVDMAAHELPQAAMLQPAVHDLGAHDLTRNPFA